ncbi:hypothetical protein AVEN_102000-1 [Araneus ventricosus]|uniref:Uncharacterized protein n=1 Tax=Araneus ventricosus TaxID=182803 RepID=A0A4Y2I979_ARAVE|nr:hypothetical protein AVEN_102000-1 [Araneus ventricosus]
MKSFGNSHPGYTGSCGSIQVTGELKSCSIPVTPRYNGQITIFCVRGGSWTALPRLSLDVSERTQKEPRNFSKERRILNIGQTKRMSPELATFPPNTERMFELRRQILRATLSQIGFGVIEFRTWNTLVSMPIYQHMAVGRYAL